MKSRLKKVLINGSKAVAVIVAYFAAYILGPIIDEAWRINIGIGIAWIAMIYLGLQIENLKERIGVQNLSKHGFQEAEARTPIVPKHEPSEPFAETSYGVKDGTVLFWKTFASFAVYTNKMLKESPWRLEERGESEVGDHYGPRYGRSYAIFYGPKNTGKLTLTDGDFSFENPETFLKYEIWGARTYPAEDIKKFAYWLAQLLLFDKRAEAADKFESVMLSALWEIDYEAAHNPDISFAMGGSAEYYVDWVRTRMKAA